MGIIFENQCVICGCEVEHIEHLFFECRYSEACIQGVRQQLEWTSKGKNLTEVMRWIKNAEISVLKKKELSIV